jgi:hypothetical protein
MKFKKLFLSSTFGFFFSHQKNPNLFGNAGSGSAPTVFNEYGSASLCPQLLSAYSIELNVKVAACVPVIYL